VTLPVRLFPDTKRRLLKARKQNFGGLTMKMKSLMSLFMLVGALIILPHCGGGGGGGGNNSGPTTAVLTLSTAVTGAIPATTTINGYDVTVTLPAGVTVQASPDSINPAVLVTDPNVVTATGSASGADVIAVYTAAVGGTPAMVKVHIASDSGFNAGAFCTITCDISAGTNPSAADFAQPTLDEATGLDSSYSTVNLTSELSLAAAAVIQ
jgi:hypothetical protein